jgi:hypothetical protein
VDALHIPLQRPDGGGTSIGQFRKAKVLEPHSVPSPVDDRGDAPEPVPDEVGSEIRRLRPGERRCQGFRLDRADGHPLTIDRVEAADRVTHGDQAGGVIAQALVKAALAADEPIGRDLRQRLRIDDAFPNARHGQRARKSHELLVRLRHPLVKEADQRHQATSALDREYSAAAARRCTGHEKQARVGRRSRSLEDTGRVRDPRREELRLGRRVTDFLEKARDRAAAAHRVDDEVGPDRRLDGIATDAADAQPRHGRSAFAKGSVEEAFCAGAGPKGDVLQRPDASADLGFEQRAAHGEKGEAVIFVPAPPAAGMIPGEIAPCVEQGGSGAAKLIGDPGKEVLDDRQTADQKRMKMPALRHALSMVRPVLDRIALDHGDLVEAFREDAGGEQAGDAAAGDDRVAEGTGLRS